MQRLNIILVEGSRLWRSFLVSTLEELGFEVFEAQDEHSTFEVLDSMREHDVKVSAIFSNSENIRRSLKTPIPIFPVPSPDEILTPLRARALRLKTES